MKKTTKVIKKTIKKEFKPAYTVDITDAVTPEDIILAFAWAKTSAVLNDAEIDAIVSDVMENTFAMMEATANSFLNVNKAVYDISNGASVIINKDGVRIEEPKPAKKPNIFKRFWNWITRKK